MREREKSRKLNREKEKNNRNEVINTKTLKLLNKKG